MPRKARREVIREDEVGIYHVWSRYTRQMFLTGPEALSGNNYEHRKGWILDRARYLSGVFAIDVCVYAVLSNHYHLLLRNRPDLVRQWSDEEVGRRWWYLFPQRFEECGLPAHPTEQELQAILTEPGRIAELRGRLSSISWMMKELNQEVATRANREDNVRGNFFDRRFRCRNLLDEGAVLVAAVYVDLNEVRARLAAVPEESRFSSSYRRILEAVARERLALGRMEDRRQEEPTITTPCAEASPAGEMVVATRAVEVPRVRNESTEGQALENCGEERQPGESWVGKWEEMVRQGPWICPINEQECAPLLGPAGAESVDASWEKLTTSGWLDETGEMKVPNEADANRSWRHGFLPMTLSAYLEFLDWNARRMIPGKAAMDEATPPILERIGLTGECWLKFVANFERWFSTAVGSAKALKEEATKRGSAWLRGIGKMHELTG